MCIRDRKRNLLIALWSAEEIGLIGSKEFVTMPPVPIDQIEAYVNFDMVGRMKDNKLAAQATGTSPVWGSLIERANVRAGFDIAIQPDPYPVSYTHLRAHETGRNLVCRLLLEKKK